MGSSASCKLESCHYYFLTEKGEKKKLGFSFWKELAVTFFENVKLPLPPWRLPHSAELNDTTRFQLLVLDSSLILEILCCSSILQEKSWLKLHAYLI